MEKILISLIALTISINLFAQDNIEKQYSESDSLMFDNHNSILDFNALCGATWFFPVNDEAAVFIEFYKDNTCKLSINIYKTEYPVAVIGDVVIGKGPFVTEGKALDWDIQKTMKMELAIYVDKQLWNSYDEGRKETIKNNVKAFIPSRKDQIAREALNVLNKWPREFFTQSQQIIQFVKDDKIIVYQNIPGRRSETVTFWNKDKHYKSRYIDLNKYTFVVKDEFELQ